MTRILLLAITLLFCSFGFAQKAPLDLENAVMGYYNGLYPESIRGLQWIPNSELYSAVNNDILYVFDKSGKIKKKLTLAEIKTTINNPELSYMPRLIWEDQNSVSLVIKDKLYIINPFKNQLKKFVDLLSLIHI